MAGISPWVIDQLNPPWIIPMVRDTQDFDLTGVSTGQISLIIYNSSFSRIKTGAGSFTILNTDPAIVQYALASGDLPSAAGTYYIRLKINFGGTTPDFSDYVQWVVQS